MEQFSCCSRLEECQKANQCTHPGTEEIPATEWRSSCSVATRYKRENHTVKDIKASIPEGKRLLLLIDGNSVMHRAFHVTPELISPCGSPSGAIYGTIKMISNLVVGRKPTHLAVALDGQGTIFRKEIYPEYKANRKPKDPRLVVQLSMLPEVLDSLNIRCLSEPEYEADDVIGTLATRAENEGFKVIILSGDGDLIQLVSENITLLLSKKGVSELLECTPVTTEYHTGIMPAQVTSFKALAGDNSDNIPGASGIGRVTAKQLLMSYGYVDNIINIVDKIPGRTGDKLRASVENVKLSLKLATICCNVPLKCSLDDCRINVDLIKGTNTLRELGINTINLLTFKSTGVSKRYRKTDVERIILRSNGRKDYCGVCGKYTSCSKFVELKDGKISILGQQFWACSECEYELISPEYYRKVTNSDSEIKIKNPIDNLEGHIQPKLFL
ncbi:MAG: 5'-3' exonuclease [Bacillota bacterium]